MQVCTCSKRLVEVGLGWIRLVKVGLRWLSVIQIRLVEGYVDFCRIKSPQVDGELWVNRLSKTGWGSVVYLEWLTRNDRTWLQCCIEVGGNRRTRTKQGTRNIKTKLHKRKAGRKLGRKERTQDKNKEETKTWISEARKKKNTREKWERNRNHKA